MSDADFEYDGIPKYFNFKSLITGHSTPKMPKTPKRGQPSSTNVQKSKPSENELHPKELVAAPSDENIDIFKEDKPALSRLSSLALFNPSSSRLAEKARRRSKLISIEPSAPAAVPPATSRSTISFNPLPEARRRTKIIPPKISLHPTLVPGFAFRRKSAIPAEERPPLAAPIRHPSVNVLGKIAASSRVPVAPIRRPSVTKNVPENTVAPSRVPVVPIRRSARIAPVKTNNVPSSSLRK